MHRQLRSLRQRHDQGGDQAVPLLRLSGLWLEQLRFTMYQAADHRAGWTFGTTDPWFYPFVDGGFAAQNGMRLMTCCLRVLGLGLFFFTAICRAFFYLRNPFARYHMRSI